MTRWFFDPWVRPILTAAIVFAFTAVPGLAQEECPTWSFSGTVSSGDGSTVPGNGALWSTCCPAPAGFYGDHPANTSIEISGGGAVGDGDYKWYAIYGGYFWSPIGGYMHCERPEGSNCGSCSGSFDLKIYASQGAVEGRVTVIPEREQGLAGIPVWLSRTPSGGSNPAYTDEQGKFEFRAKEGLARSNNWGVGVDPNYSPWPHSATGYATYYVGTTGAAIKTVTVASSELATADLVIRHDRVEDPEMRCNTGSGSGGGGGPGPPPESAGKPVNVITGNVYFDQTDIVIPGIQGLAFVRSYNSKNAFRDQDTDMSRGWSHTYSRTLTFPDSISIDFRGDDGVPLYYQDVDGDDIFDAALPANERTRVVRDGDQFRREFPAGAYETFDATGRLTSIVDQSGNAIEFERNSDGLVNRISDPGGRFLALSYDDRDRLSSLSVGSMVVAAYEYDASNFLRRVSYPGGSGYVFTYDGRGQLLRVEDASGRAIESHEYGSHDTASFALTSEIADGQEKLTFNYEPWRTTVTDVEGNSTVYDWRWVNGLRRVVKITGPCGACGGGGADSQEWSYDDAGRIEEYRENDETPTRYSYDAEGRLETEVDPLARTTTYTYDNKDRPLTVETPGGGLVSATYGDHGPLTITKKLTEITSRTTTYTYTTRGQVDTITDPRGKVTTYGYDTDGDLETVTDPLGHVTHFTFDDLGQRTTVTDALGHTAKSAYGNIGQVIRVDRPDGSSVGFDYDAGGRRTAATDPLGRTVRTLYGPYGRLAETVNPIGEITRYEYDAMGRLTSLSDANGRSTSFEYGERDKLSKVTYPGGAFESFTHDGKGLLETRTDRNGVVTTYSYDDLGRLTGRAYSDGTPEVSFTYDTGGRLDTASNESDTVIWTYDLAGQVLSETSTRNGSTVTYGYDLSGNRQTVSLDGELFVEYTYDDAGRLETITRGSQVVDFGYDEVNRRIEMAYPNGVTTGFAYDDFDRTTNLSTTNGPTSISSIGYTWDASGNQTSKTTLEFTESYGYDELSRLVQVERSALQEYWHFEYDEAGNRTVVQHDTDLNTATHDENNRLVAVDGGGFLRVRGVLDESGTATVNGQPVRMLEDNVFEATVEASIGTTTFTVEATDISGNTSSRDYEVEITGAEAMYEYDDNGNLVARTEGGSTWGYEWNAENQLYRVIRDGAEIATFAYDATGRRVEKTAGGMTHTYLYDGLDILVETITDGGASSAFLYVHGPGIDEPLAREDVATGALSYYHADNLGSIVMMTDQAGGVLNSARYDPWGNLEVGADRAGYAFTGREWDPETGLYYYRARYFNPRLGRFISEDPIRFMAGNNFYAYVLNSPVDTVDPLGLRGQNKHPGKPKTSSAVSVSCKLWGIFNMHGTSSSQGHSLIGFNLSFPQDSDVLCGCSVNVLLIPTPMNRKELGECLSGFSLGGSFGVGGTASSSGCYSMDFSTSPEPTGEISYSYCLNCDDDFLQGTENVFRIQRENLERNK